MRKCKSNYILQITETAINLLFKIDTLCGCDALGKFVVAKILKIYFG